MRRPLLVLAAALGVGLPVVGAAPFAGTAPTATAQAPVASVVVDGTGNGHGRGMSQWGAFGRANAGQSYDQILQAYYGNTSPAAVDTLRTIDVQLKALDGVGIVGVNSDVNDVRWAGTPTPAPAMYAQEIAPNVFNVWAVSERTCAPLESLGSRATLVGASVPGPIEFTTTGNGSVDGNRRTTGPALSALAVCDGSGRVTYYRGSIRMEDRSGGANRVVNRVLVEDYLRGVVPKEISPSWPAESVKAQAVAARSYALQPNRWADGICDTQSCQVYFGTASRDSIMSNHRMVEDVRSDQAIAATVGQVRVWQPGAPGAAGTIVSTEFSASNGPRTAGWPFPAVDDSQFDSTPQNRNHRWTRTLDAAGLASRYGLGTLLAVSQVDNNAPPYDGIWYNDVRLVGTARTVTVPAWTFRNNHGLPSPGFTVRGEALPSSAIGANQRIELPVEGAVVTGTDGVQRTVPDGVSAVALNITAVGPSAPGYATVWPCDVARPEASNLNFAAGSVVANGVIAPVGASGKVCFFSNAGTHFLVDIAGWFAPGASTRSTFTGATPTRVLDTRNGIGGPRTRIAAGGTITVPVGGLPLRLTNSTPAAVPADATAVAVNVTAVGPSRGGYFTVWPCGRPRPTTSNVNFAPGSIVANGVIAPVGEGGAICVFSDQASDVLVDVLGWFGGGGQPAFVGAVPSRLVDTRNAIGGPTGVVTPGSPRSVPVRGVTLDVNGVARQVPADASAVALNVTIVGAAAQGYATVWPCGTPRPEASNVNFAAGATVANGVVAPIGPDGSVCVFSSVGAHLLVDIAGWFAGGADAPFVGNVPIRMVDTRNNIGPRPI